MTALEELQSLIPRYHVKIDGGRDSCVWWCYIGEWSNTEPTNWIAADSGETMEEAASKALANLRAGATTQE